MGGTPLPFSVPLCVQTGPAALITFPQLMPPYSEFVVNIPIIHGKSQGGEVSYSVGQHDNVFGFLAETLFWVSWRGLDDLLKHVKSPLAGSKCGFTPFPAVSTDVVLTELTATEPPFCLPGCVLIDL